MKRRLNKAYNLEVNDIDLMIVKEVFRTIHKMYQEGDRVAYIAITGGKNYDKSKAESISGVDEAVEGKEQYIRVHE